MSSKPDQDHLAATAVSEADEQKSNIRQFIPRGQAAPATQIGATAPVSSPARDIDSGSGDDDDPGPTAA